MATVAELIKKELGVEVLKVSEEEKAKGKTSVGNLSMEQVLKIAKQKANELLAKDIKAAVKTVLGSIVTMPLTVENKSAKEILKEIEEGKWDDLFKEVMKV
jgi:large subunit ribosomal protein L11